MPTPYRIITRIFPTVEGADATQSVNGENFRDYLDRLQKLIPSEIIGIYLFARNLSEHRLSADSRWFDNFVNNYLGLICVLTLIPLRAWGTRLYGKAPQWGAVGIAGISFALWVYLIGDSILGFVITDKRVIVFVAALWTLISAWLYKGEQRFEGGIPLD